MLELLAPFLGAILYRLRGGMWRDLTGAQRWYNGTHMMRAIWSLPTAGLIYALAGGPWWMMAALFVSVFASMALIGHGAHMVYSREELRKAHWQGQGQDVELLTGFWLPLVFEERPNVTWPTWRAFLFHGMGMSFIGIVRNTIAALPLIVAAPAFVALYALTGALHGPAYWLGWRLPGASSANGEYIVGGLSWLTIVLLLR